jgi:hypothetical protein
MDLVGGATRMASHTDRLAAGKICPDEPEAHAVTGGVAVSSTVIHPLRSEVGGFYLVRVDVGVLGEQSVRQVDLNVI